MSARVQKVRGYEGATVRGCEGATVVWYYGVTALWHYGVNLKNNSRTWELILERTKYQQLYC